MEIQVTGRSMLQSSQELPKRLLRLAGSGAAAFWFTDFFLAVSPFAAEYKSAFSITNLPVALAGALVGGIITGLIVSYFLLRFFNRIPSKNPILKALILSLFVMVVIEVFSALGNPAHASVYLLLDTLMNAPRFLVLGLVTGYLFDKQKGKV